MIDPNIIFQKISSQLESMLSVLKKGLGVTDDSVKEEKKSNTSRKELGKSLIQNGKSLAQNSQVIQKIDWFLKNRIWDTLQQANKNQVQSISINRSLWGITNVVNSTMSNLPGGFKGALETTMELFSQGITRYDRNLVELSTWTKYTGQNVGVVGNTINSLAGILILSKDNTALLTDATVDLSRTYHIDSNKLLQGLASLEQTLLPFAGIKAGMGLEVGLKMETLATVLGEALGSQIQAENLLRPIFAAISQQTFETAGINVTTGLKTLSDILNTMGQQDVKGVEKFFSALLASSEKVSSLVGGISNIETFRLMEQVLGPGAAAIRIAGETLTQKESELQIAIQKLIMDNGSTRDASKTLKAGLDETFGGLDYLANGLLSVAVPALTSLTGAVTTLTTAYLASKPISGLGLLSGKGLLMKLGVFGMVAGLIWTGFEIFKPLFKSSTDDTVEAVEGVKKELQMQTQKLTESNKDTGNIIDSYFINELRSGFRDDDTKKLLEAIYSVILGFSIDKQLQG